MWCIILACGHCIYNAIEDIYRIVRPLGLVVKDGSQSDKNDSEEEEEHKSLDNVSEAKDPDDYFDNGEGNKTCL